MSSNAGNDGAEDDQAVDARRRRAGVGGQLQHTGGENYRGGKEERETRGVPVGQAADEAAIVTPERPMPASNADVCTNPMTPASR